MDIGKVLRTKWYPKYKPSNAVSRFEIKAWRILVINSGTVPGKPLLCQQYGDGSQKTKHFNFNDLEKDFTTEEMLVRYLANNGFKLVDKREGVLKFATIKSDS